MEPADYHRLINRDMITAADATTFPNSGEIPERFIRTDEVQAAGAIVGEEEAYELPVVDMANLLDPELSASETAKLGSACRDWGFFQLTNHGVERGRTTVVVFQDASLDDGTVAPLPELLVSDGDAPRYEAMERLEFSKGHLRALAQGTRFPDSLRTPSSS